MKLTILCVFILFCSGVPAAVKVSVYYETLCPDSIAFIKNQLHYNYKKFGSQLVQLELIPYGFAKEETVNGTKTFTCQHGPNECYGNEVQGCVIASTKILTSETFVYCAESADSPTSIETFKACAAELNIPWSDVEACLTNGDAIEIMSKNGEKTNALHTSWIPTIVFNDTFNEDDSKQSESDFRAVVCKYLDNEPDQCRDSENIHVVLV